MKEKKKKIGRLGSEGKRDFRTVREEFRRQASGKSAAYQ
jgi:hypothetical protein